MRVIWKIISNNPQLDSNFGVNNNSLDFCQCPDAAGAKRFPNFLSIFINRNFLQIWLESSFCRLFWPGTVLSKLGGFSTMFTLSHNPSTSFTLMRILKFHFNQLETYLETSHFALISRLILPAIKPENLTIQSPSPQGKPYRPSVFMLSFGIW